MREDVKKKYVSKILSPFLQEKGFAEEYYEEDVDGSSWVYKRKAEKNRIQVIEIIDKFRYSILQFYIYGERRKYTISDLDMPHLELMNEFVKYDNEVEFSSMIVYYKELIDQRILDYLNKLSTERKSVILTLEHYDYVKYNNAKRWEKFEQENKGIDSVEFISIIKQQVSFLDGKPFEEVVWGLLDITCIYGNWIINNYGGNWSKLGKGYGLINVGSLKRNCNPCNDIIKLWKKELIISPEVLEQYYGKTAR